MTGITIPDELSCKGCSNIDVIKMNCAFGFQLGKDEWAQTFGMWSFLNQKPCKFKNVKPCPWCEGKGLLTDEGEPIKDN